MVQGQTKPIYKSAAFATSEPANLKKSQCDYKAQERKEIPKMNVEKKADPWGKIFKNEKHFKSFHIC
ncbi:CLUMA_CG013875, isoform A [Clunio marinus]|uniref:CLUMA_CG013875, isoform A n=1 Tax=Clunio marinus TaxID=568069 RepID=A0A1J1IK48_9DIPT|nr:CLUMA_CG013875, isoform A [Clunio marinus]